MSRYTPLGILASALLAISAGTSAQAQQVSVYDNFGPGNGGWDHNWGLGWTVAGINVPNQYGVEQAMSFQATASGVVTDIWLAMWHVPMSTLVDVVTVRLARNPAGLPPTPQDVMEEWTLSSFPSWSQWSPPHHLQGSRRSYLEQGSSYWLWAVAGDTTWCGWCMNVDPQRTIAHAMRREGQNWLPISMETASAFRVDIAVDFGLAADRYSISRATGGAITFHLGAGATNASRNYLLLAGASGTSPGVPLPGGAATLPLNLDAVTNAVLLATNTPAFGSFAGSLDSRGTATAILDTLGPLPPGSAGFTLWFADTLFFPLDYASNPVAIVIDP